MAAMAAAQLCRADAGREEYPRIPFGTRVMIVIGPKPRNAFVARAEPGPIFGPDSSASDCFGAYSGGHVKSKRHIAIQGMTESDLNGVKVNMSNWDSPDACQ